MRLTATAESIVRSGHPWVFADSIKEQNREGITGELAVIFDRNDKFLAVGFFDPDSPIRVRVVHVGKPTVIDDEFWRMRLDATVRRRDGLFDHRTTGYRIINGESDGWPGLVLDRYDTTLVLKIYTAAWLNRLDAISGLIRERLNPDKTVLRVSRNVERRSPTRLDENVLFQNHAGPEAGAPVIFSESGIRFEADVWRGQKTGFFLDQRENRRMIESLSPGRTVLNAFSFSGGFSLYAARGGAKSVTDLDISKHALHSARRNFALNAGDSQIAACRHESIQADAFDWLAGNAERQFDLIILDPPSLAKREIERPGAIRAYGKLVESGLKHLRSGGILLACSCSAHVSAEEFFGAVRQAARQSGRKFTELRTTRHAPDHHASFPEAEYLKGIYLQF
ncbi:MAG TPA: class I SAM-dependent rRNA methyltransferase [Verrucomicrobiae bacterium]|nr:class I SAM-dependent rRNA methyltransferase [Verrucomicrobiae bacterium]